jgi:hypothetical protein
MPKNQAKKGWVSENAALRASRQGFLRLGAILA